MRRLLIALGLTLAAGIMASGIMAGVIWLVTYGFSHSMLLCRLIFYAPPVIFILRCPGGMPVLGTLLAWNHLRGALLGKDKRGRSLRELPPSASTKSWRNLSGFI